MADSSLFRNLCILHLQRLTLELKCPLCLNLLNNPVVFPCNHIFCNDCIAMSEQNKCPTCQLQCIDQEIRSAPYMEGIVRLCQSLEETVNAKVDQSSSAGMIGKPTPPSITNIRCNARKEHLSNILQKRIYANIQPDGLLNNKKGETDSKKLRPAAREDAEQNPECVIIIDDEDVNIKIKEEPHTEDSKVAEGNMQDDLVNNNRGETDLKKLQPAPSAEVEQSPDCVVISDDDYVNTTIKEEPQTESQKVAERNSKYPDNQSPMAVGRKDKIKKAMQLVRTYKKRRLANSALALKLPIFKRSAYSVLNAPVVSSQSVGTSNRQLRDESINSANSSDSFLKGDSLGTRATPKASGTANAGTFGGTSVVLKKLQGYEQHTPPTFISTKMEVQLVKGRLLCQESVDGWFRLIMRDNMDGFYPLWTKVPVKKKDRLWHMFLEEHDISKLPYNKAYATFMKQNREKYRRFLHAMKTDAMNEHNVSDVSELLEKAKPSFMKSNAVWQEYVRYWCSSKQRAKTEQAKKNRASCGSRPDGQSCSNRLGRKSLAERIYDEEKATGKKVSALKILMKVNKKKDKDKDKHPTGEYYDLELQNAILEYMSKYKERHGAEVDPFDHDIERDLWMATEPVSRGLSKGRVLGLGTSNQAEAFMV